MITQRLERLLRIVYNDLRGQPYGGCVVGSGVRFDGFCAASFYFFRSSYILSIPWRTISERVSFSFSAHSSSLLKDESSRRTRNIVCFEFGDGGRPTFFCDICSLLSCRYFNYNIVATRSQYPHIKKHAFGVPFLKWISGYAGTPLPTIFSGRRKFCQFLCAQYPM